MPERVITLTVTDKGLTSSARVVGYAGEHLATRLKFVVPQSWAEDTTLQYYVGYRTSTGQCYKTDLLDWPVEVLIPQAVTVAGNLKIQLIAVKTAGDDTIVSKSACCDTEIGQSVCAGQTITDDPTAGLIEQSLVEFDLAMDELNELLGGGALDPDAWQAVTEQSQEAIEISKQVQSVIDRNSLIANRNRRPMITLIDDDGAKQYMTKWLPIVQSKGIKMSCAVVTDWVNQGGTYMDWADLDTIAAAGVEILSHSKDHDYETIATQTVDEITANFAAAKAELAAHGHDTDIIVYPGSTGDNATVRDAARNVYAAGIISGGNKVLTPPLETYRLSRYYLDSATTPTLDYFKGIADEVVANNGWAILMSHSQNATMDDDMLDTIEQLIDYAKSIGIDFVTAKEGLKSIGNALECGRDRDAGIVDADGNFNGTGVGVGVSEQQLHHYYSNHDDYASCNVTSEIIRPTSSQGYPDGMGGLLITYTSTGYVYQLFLSNKANRIYYRSTVTNGGEMGEFTPLSSVSSTTANLPSMGSETVGNCIYDTDVNRPKWVKTAGVKTASKIEITDTATTNGNIKIGSVSIPVTTDMTCEDIAAAIAAANIAGWNKIQDGATVYLTRLAATATAKLSYSDPDNTGVTANDTLIRAGAAAEYTDIAMQGPDIVTLADKAAYDALENKDPATIYVWGLNNE